MSHSVVYIYIYILVSRNHSHKNSIWGTVSIAIPRSNLKEHLKYLRSERRALACNSLLHMLPYLIKNK